MTEQTTAQPNLEATDSAEVVNETPEANEQTPLAEETPTEAETGSSEPEQNELALAQAEAKKYLDAWQRERAEFSNYKKRMERERVEAFDSAVNDVIKTLLPIIDDFERAIENVPEDQQKNPFVEGTVAIERKLHRLLEKYDIEEIDPVGQPFDPDLHQALGIDENAEMEAGTISVTLQKGYRKGERLLRQALVRVAG